ATVYRLPARSPDKIRRMTPDFTLDFDRLRRVGFPEVVLGDGKSAAQIAEICRQLSRAHDVLVTRLSPEAWEEVAANPLPGRADYDPRSHTLLLFVGKPMPRVEGTVCVLTAGTMDTAVAEEARRTLEYLGVSSTLVPDVGVAGLLRLLSRLEEIERSDVVIAVAGMEASLFSVIAGLVGRPVIAVPTARGYGAAFSGLASLLAAVNSCANGVAAVNIDSGYGAAMAAYRILSGGPRRWDRKRKPQEAPASTRTKPRSGSTASARRRSSADRRRRSG
ncbi:MAG TPA: nickel pincer cofactor biosynthesis protein LarB, partial [Thermoanaerobaculia bacterium]|nr:nickel pincer cofactor biosynthesis protein LarB [Thermoanaerobaculia bacterium]